MKRMMAVVLVAVALASPVSADTVGSRLARAANRRCAVAGMVLERHGLTERERGILARRECKREPNGTWDSARIFTQ